MIYVCTGTGSILICISFLSLSYSLNEGSKPSTDSAIYISSDSHRDSSSDAERCEDKNHRSRDIHHGVHAGYNIINNTSDTTGPEGGLSASLL